MARSADSFAMKIRSEFDFQVAQSKDQLPLVPRSSIFRKCRILLVSSVPGLTDSGKLTLVRRLVKEGLLQIGAAS